MSDLVLMMWLVDVVSVSQGMGLLGGMGALVMTSWFVFWKFSEAQSYEDVPKPPKSLIALCIALCLTAWIMPSKQTLYAAIAIKAGHEISESRIGSKAVTALEGVLDEVIAKQKKGEK